MKRIKFRILNYDDRKEMVFALANAGYMVTTDCKEGLGSEHYFVIVEVKDEDIGE